MPAGGMYRFGGQLCSVEPEGFVTKRVEHASLRDAIPLRLFKKLLDGSQEDAVNGKRVSAGKAACSGDKGPIPCCLRSRAINDKM